MDSISSSAKLSVPTKPQMMEACKNDLLKIVDFIQLYLPLANLHNTNFIIANYWKQVPKPIQDGLLSCKQEDLSKLLIDDTYNPTSPVHPDEEMPWTPDETVWPHVPPEMKKGLIQPADPDQPLTWHHTQLDSFLADAKACYLDRMEYTKLSECLADHTLPKDNDTDRLFIKHSMCEKKGHEVEKMAEFCNQLAKHKNLKHVVDLGSGKGYLATSLSLQYGLTVVGIDSQEGNTHGALKRKTKLEKQFNGLVRKEQRYKQKTDDGIDPKIGRKKHAKEQRLQAIQNRVNDNNESKNAGYEAVTAFIGPEDDLQKHTQQYIPDEKVLLTGLHTCGNLAASSMKLFLRSRSCPAMINVGCCYHLLDEMFFINPFLSDGEEAPPPQFPLSQTLLEKHFKLGRNCRMLSLQALEKVATEENGIADAYRCLFWRALLQKILLDIHGYWRKDWIVGKTRSNCKTFVQYVKKAMKKLDIQKQLSDEAIEAYEKTFEYAKKEMSLFFQLRSALAPAIEAIVLLDRCLYLMEQEETDVVILKRLFNPIVSPRCYAIIASKAEV